jgi:hypothetical protein
MSTLSRDILRTGDFVYRLHTESVAAMPGAVTVRLTSVWQQARQPKEEVCKLSLTLKRDELKTLIEGLQAGLTQV